MSLTKAVFVMALSCAAGMAAGGQTSPPAIVTVDVDNTVVYVGDVADIGKLATTGTATTAADSKNFYAVLWVADVVAVNGKPAKGTWTARGNVLSRGPNPPSGTAIADSGGALFFDWIFDLMQADGTPIGSLMAVGTGGAPKPPGALSSFLQANMTVTGGTGMYLGVRGQAGQGGNTVSPRFASMSEDPATRRVLGGGKRRYIFHLIPMFQPEVVLTSSGLALVHSADYSLVNSANPARAGEILVLFASGLGPTRPGVDPGQPFPLTPLQPVNSPVEVSVNGIAAEVTWAGGYPGAVDRYQVNFRVPDTAGAGTALLRLTSGYIPGAEQPVPIH